MAVAHTTSGLRGLLCALERPLRALGSLGAADLRRMSVLCSFVRLAEVHGTARGNTTVRAPAPSITGPELSARNRGVAGGIG